MAVCVDVRVEGGGMGGSVEDYFGRGEGVGCGETDSQGKGFASVERVRRAFKGTKEGAWRATFGRLIEIKSRN